MATKLPDKPLTTGQKVWRESAGLGIAEFASGVTSLGVVAVADDLLPSWNKAASKKLSKIVIEPYLDSIEHWAQKICKLKECQPDFSKPREERAEKIAHTLVLFGEAWVVSMLAKLGVRKLTNKKFGIDTGKEARTGNWFLDKVVYRKLNKHDWNVILWDEGVHLGSFIVSNFVMAKQTDQLIDGIGGILQKALGWSKERANNVASMFMIWEVPNFLGFGAGIAKIAHFHKKQAQNAISDVISKGPSPHV